jgi:hypothetical protein
MIRAERGRIWDANGKVCEDGKETVGEWGTECEVMADFVD